MQKIFHWRVFLLFAIACIFPVMAQPSMGQRAPADSPGAMTSMVLVANLENGDATVTLHIYNASGTEVHSTTKVIAGKGAATFNVPSSVGAGFSGSAIVDADRKIHALVLDANANNAARELYEGTLEPNTIVSFPVFRHLGSDAQKSVITIQNMNPSANAALTFHYYNSNGTEAAGSPLAPVNVAPFSSAQFDSQTLFGANIFTYSARVESDQNIAGAAQVLFEQDTAALRGLTANDEGTAHVLNWIERKVKQTSGKIKSWSEIFVHNRGDETTHVTLTYFKTDGSVKTSHAADIAPNGFQTFSTKNLGGLSNKFAGYARVTQTKQEPLVVEWLEVNGVGKQFFGFNGIPVNAAASAWVCADARRVTNAPTQYTKFKVANMGNGAANVRVELRKASNGNVLATANYALDAGMQLTVDLSNTAFSAAGGNYKGLAIIKATNGKALVVNARTSFGKDGATGYSCAALP